MLSLSRRLFVLVVLLLSSSLAANAYFYLLPSSPPPSAAKVAPPPPERRDEGDPTCAAELDACRRAATGIVRGPWGGILPPAVSAVPGAPSPSPAPRAAADPRGSLCRVARDNMRGQWLEKRDFITAVLVHDLTDTVKQQADAQRDADRAAETLGLSGSRRRGFESDFIELRTRRMADLAATTKTNPMDWSGLLTGARSLFDGEDVLVQTQLGADALGQYQDSESDRRMTILSVLATYAGVDWDEAVSH